MTDVPPCFLCGKTHKEVRRLILGPVNFEDVGRLGLEAIPRRAICSECIILNAEMLASGNAAIRDELVALLQAIRPKNSN